MKIEYRLEVRVNDELVFHMENDASSVIQLALDRADEAVERALKAEAEDEQA